MYEYTERLMAPNIVEFYCLNPQGHRIVRIYLDGHTPRIVAFNESSSKRTYATLFLVEVLVLISRARILVGLDDVSESPMTWIVEILPKVQEELDEYYERISQDEDQRS